MNATDLVNRGGPLSAVSTLGSLAVAVVVLARLLGNEATWVVVVGVIGLVLLLGSWAYALAVTRRSRRNAR